MSRGARRATTALLCGVVLVALGFAIAASPDAERAPQSLRVDVAFDPFVPGVTQTRTTSMEVPVPSRVAEARIDATRMPIRVELAVCQLDTCRPIVVGSELEPGPYTLIVASTLDTQVAAGTSGEIVGQIRLVEARQPIADDATLLRTAFAGFVAVGIVVGALMYLQRQRIAR